MARLLYSRSGRSDSVDCGPDLIGYGLRPASGDAFGGDGVSDADLEVRSAVAEHFAREQRHLDVELQA